MLEPNFTWTERAQRDKYYGFGGLFEVQRVLRTRARSFPGEGVLHSVRLSRTVEPPGGDLVYIDTRTSTGMFLSER